MASTEKVPLPWIGTVTCVSAAPANSTNRRRTSAFMAMKRRSRDPQSCSIARLTLSEVVRGPGVSSQGSRSALIEIS
jgi:hypothetical protein